MQYDIIVSDDNFVSSERVSASVEQKQDIADNLIMGVHGVSFCLQRQHSQNFQIKINYIKYTVAFVDEINHVVSIAQNCILSLKEVNDSNSRTKDE